jgi:hypothetical protein
MVVGYLVFKEDLFTFNRGLIGPSSNSVCAFKLVPPKTGHEDSAHLVLLQCVTL